MDRDSIKEQVKEATDIVGVIGQFVSLKKRGASMLGLCPFHTEKTPSFNVHPTRQFFHCFGCGKGGDVFTFLMEHEGWSFPEALKYCADRAGIRLPERGADEDRQARRRRMLLEALSLADSMYRRLLFSNEGQAALDYMNGRGFGNETLKKAGVGYAPNAFDRLLNAAQGRGMHPKVLEAAGLTSISKTGKPYDRFRNRITFPIISLSNHTVGFGARALAKDDEPKYLNSPESDLYHKSRILYGLSFTRESIRKEDRVLIVEGYLDWLRMIDFGLTHTVAVSGTALTEQQTQLLARFCSRAVLMFDADSAGQRATLRGIDIAFNAGLGVDVVELPAGDDPDTYVGREGAESLRHLIEKAPSIVDYRVRVARNEAGGVFDFLAREKLVKELVDLARRIQDRDRREAFIGEAAGFLEIPEAHLRRTLGSPSNVHKNASTKSGITSRVILTRDEEFLRVLIDNADYVRQAREVVLPTDFDNPLHRRMYDALTQRVKSGDSTISPDALGDSPAEVTAWSFLLSHEIAPELRDRVFSDAMAAFMRKHRPASRLKHLITQAERAGDREAVARLTSELAEKLRLDNEKHGDAPETTESTASREGSS